MAKKTIQNQKSGNSKSRRESPARDMLRIFDNLPVMMWRSGKDGLWDFFNQSWLSFTGLSMADAIGERWLSAVNPEDAAHLQETYQQAFTAQAPFDIQYRLRHHSGEYRWIHDNGRPNHNIHGDFAGFIGTSYDLTDRKSLENELVEANQALREREAMFKGLFEQAPDAVIAVNREGIILLANERVHELFGYARDDVIGHPVEMLLPEVTGDLHRKHVANYAAQPHRRPMGAGLALFGRRSDGSLFPVDINLGPLQTEKEFIVLATIRDTTDRKQAEEAIREREKLLTTAALSAPIVFFKLDTQGVIQLSLGRSMAGRLKNVDSIGRTIYDLYADIPKAIESFKRALSGETITTVIEGGGLTYEATFAPVHSEEGAITGVVGVASDVTRHRQVEEALVESEAHFRTIFRDATLGICLVDQEGHVIETNPAIQEMLGYSQDELQQKSFAGLSHPEDAALIHQQVDELITGKEEHFQRELRLIHKDGQALWVRLGMSLFRSQDGSPWYEIAMIDDNTVQKQVEAELAELQRRLIDSTEIERLRLAQELHDGPLQEIQAVSFRISALQEMVNGSQGQRNLEELQAELHRVAQSIRSVCGELRPPALAPFGLERAIRSHADQFAEQHPEITLSLDLDQDNQDLNERVRLVLFRIYQHSMANILRHSHARNVDVSFHFDDRQIELRIADDGRGFEIPGRWIDLLRKGHFGLVGSIERAESVGGKLDLQSQLEGGTVIHVTVPRHEDEQIPPRERYSNSMFNGH